MKIIVILFSSMLLALPIYGQNRETDYLSHVLEKMNAVESVTYHCVKKAWEPGDKEPVYSVPTEIYEHVNPQDTAVGYFSCVPRIRNSDNHFGYMTELCLLT